MVWIVRADRHWYRFEDLASAERHYDYIFNNRNDKYKIVEKLYLAEYCDNKEPKILRMWFRPQEEEEISREK